MALTSARNAAYVRDTGLYHRTLTYEAVASVSAAAPVVYLDFLGRDALTAAVHRALGASLVRSILIGATDWGNKPGGVQSPTAALEGPKPEFVFVPAYAAARIMSDGELGAAMQRDLRAFYSLSRALVSRAGSPVPTRSSKAGRALPPAPPRRGKGWYSHSSCFEVPLA